MDRRPLPRRLPRLGPVLARALAAALAGLLVPVTAVACATCLDSAYGNRAFSWVFAGLMAAPFVVAAGLFGGVAWLRRRSADAGRGRQTPGGQG